MANSKGERSEIEARMNEPESESKKIEWKEPEGLTVIVYDRAYVKELMEDLRDALRIADCIWDTEEDFKLINRILTRVLEVYGAQGFFAYVEEDGRLNTEEGVEYIVIVPAVQIVELSDYIPLPVMWGQRNCIPSYQEQKKLKTFFIVDRDGWRIVTEGDEDFRIFEEYIKHVGVSSIEPIFCSHII